MKNKDNTISLGRRSFIKGGAMALAAAALPGCASWPFASPYRKRFDFNEDGTLTFFMLADWHLRMNHIGGHKGFLGNFKRSLLRYKPAFVVFAGDNLNTDENKVGSFEALMKPFVDVLKETGVSLCVGFGNHDSEKAQDNPGFFSRQAQYDWLKEQLGDCFIDHDVPELYGVGTGVVPIYKKGASRPSFKLYVMDSGDYPARNADGSASHRLGWDNPRSDQIAWYMRESADKVPHVCIQHIVVPDIFTNGLFEPAAKGEKGAFGGCVVPDGKGGDKRVWLRPTARMMTKHAKCNEIPCPARWKTYLDKDHTVDGVTLYEAWRRSGCMKGAFFGHDHSNSFDAVDDNGIRLGNTQIFNQGRFRIFKVRDDGTYETRMTRM